MHEYHKKAEWIAKGTVRGLGRIISQDGEDISCYNPEAIDQYISNLIEVRTLMARANEALNHEKK